MVVLVVLSVADVVAVVTEMDAKIKNSILHTQRTVLIKAKYLHGNFSFNENGAVIIFRTRLK